jgi:cellulose synthase/poly-beta-1,6-N-acetylglucosamine synthase-like glycosyltransferase
MSYVETIVQAAGRMGAVASVPGTLELALLTAGSMLPGRRRAAPTGKFGRLAVVIPAHNEELSIGACLKSLLACTGLPELAEIFVVADNCSDGTAAVVRSLGVNVLERNDTSNRGKGHALLFAFGHLRNQAFDAFLVIDADARVEPNLLVECSAAFAAGAGAIQCPYLVSNAEGSHSTRLLDLALRAFNLVRPRGRGRLGLSAGILGNGWGVSREVLDRVPYTAFSVVEDLEYHLALVDAGVKVEYVGSTVVYGLMPAGGTGRATQRARWEGGRLRIMRERFTWLLGRALRGDLHFAEILLDLLLMPLAFHVLLLASALTSPGFARTAGFTGFAVLAVHIALASAAGRSPLNDLKALARVPLYLVWKLAQMPRIITTSARAAGWVRTARAGEQGVA